MSLLTLLELVEVERAVGVKAYGRRRGECAGVASGVWSGVGESESCEKVGEDGAVDCGELGRDRLCPGRR